MRLADVADVGDGSAEVRAFAQLDGRPVVGFEVSKTKDASEVSTEDGVDATIAKIEKEQPGVADPQDRLRGRSHPRQLLGDACTPCSKAWCWRRWWSGCSCATGGRRRSPRWPCRPRSSRPSPSWRAVGFTLNTVTLLGLTLVIGILVDDAIVEIENIEKRVFVGMRPYDAAIEGADQIGLAVVATTFAIVAVFLPVGLMPGIPGQFFREFGITVSVAVLFSLVVARLLTPLMAAYFLKPKPARERPPLPRVYTGALGWALDHNGLASPSAR